MRYLRTSTLGLLVVGFCVIMLGLYGCGKPEEGTRAFTPVVKETAEVMEEAVPTPSDEPITEERTYYDFERNLSGWEIPTWTEGKTDYVAQDIMVSKDVASKGSASLKVMSDFPGGTWTASLVEIQQYLDLSSYRVISLDMYIPEDAPVGLKAKIILTVGDNWKFVEMSRSVPLVPGEWVTVTGVIEPGSYDWKRVVPDAKFAEDVRKIAIRVESNRKPKYTGPIYIDNVRVGR